MALNERTFMPTTSQSGPEELIDAVLHANAEEERALRIHLGNAQFDEIRSIGTQVVGDRGVSIPRGNVVGLHDR